MYPGRLDRRADAAFLRDHADRAPVGTAFLGADGQRHDRAAALELGRDHRSRRVYFRFSLKYGPAIEEKILARYHQRKK